MSKKIVISAEKVIVAPLAPLVNVFEKLPVKPSNRGVNESPIPIPFRTAFVSLAEARAYYKAEYEKAGSRSHFLSGLMMGDGITDAQGVRALELAGYYASKKVTEVAKQFATVTTHQPQGQKWFTGYKVTSTGARSERKRAIVKI